MLFSVVYHLFTILKSYPFFYWSFYMGDNKNMMQYVSFVWKIKENMMQYVFCYLMRTHGMFSPEIANELRAFYWMEYAKHDSSRETTQQVRYLALCDRITHTQTPPRRSRPDQVWMDGRAVKIVVARKDNTKRWRQRQHICPQSAECAWRNCLRARYMESIKCIQLICSCCMCVFTYVHTFVSVWRRSIKN